MILRNDQKYIWKNDINDIGSYPEASNKYIVGIIDYFSNWSNAYAVPN